MASPPVIVERVTLRDFRSYESLELALPPGLVLVTGRNGVGKTNLLEALHVGTQGFSPRTRAEAQLVRFGAGAGRVSLVGAEDRAPVETQVTIARGEGKRVVLNGATVASTEALRTRIAALVFLPDRLAVVKGGPLVRRSFFDRMLGRVTPAHAALPAEYSRALAQRNESLRRVRAGVSAREAVEPWTRALAESGTELDRARADLVRLVAPGFAEAAELLGLHQATLAYEERAVTVADLEARYAHDLARGITSIGPHLRDVGIAAASRELRSFGSQGEQRAAVLALLLAEARILAERRGAPPLLLLDDVFSELDEERRGALLRSLPDGSQTVVTATARTALPRSTPDPALVVEVTPGQAAAA
ncbi:MAG: DNA replication and repair protein RecF [Actinobacteria bacterium]|nr:DNA replication and repair protein RecF [Actinomycetota bacterium]